MLKSDLIFDVGLHRGEDSELYLKKGFKVVAVEANPELCTFVQDRLRSYVASKQLIVVNAAIAERDGPVSFFVNDRVSDWGTTSREWVNRNDKLGANSHEITVAGVTFDRLLEEFGIPYYLKIDIEGADSLCVRALAKFSDRPKHVSIESNKTSWNDLVGEVRMFRSLGYSRFKIVDQSCVENQVCPRPATEGNYVEHRFKLGASGLFGDEAPGPWLSEQQTLTHYRRIFNRYRLFGDSGILRDARPILARMPFFWRFARFMDVGWYDTHATY